MSEAAPRSFKVFKVKDKLDMPDPEETETRYHTVIFVRTSLDGSGWVHHVTGDITNGMKYERKPGNAPESSEVFHRKDVLGNVQASDYPDAMDRILLLQPPPHPRKAFNIRTYKTEACKPDGTFYGQHEQRPKFFKCTEWVEEKAIPALLQGGIIQLDHERSVK
jgi:hypothetical protein